MISRHRLARIERGVGVLEHDLRGAPHGARRSAAFAVTSSPAIRTRAAVGLDAGAGSGGPSVVLPEPDSPTRPSTSPAAIVSDTPSTARIARRPEARPPALEGESGEAALSVKVLARPLAATTGSAGRCARHGAATRRVLARQRATARRRVRLDAVAAHGAARRWPKRLRRARTASSRRGSAAGNRQPAGGSRRSGSRPGNGRQPAVGSCPGAGSRPAGPLCRDAAAARSTSAVAPLLDHLAGVEHGDLVGDAPHHAEIVADEQHRQAAPALQLLQQVEDLRLDGDVERRRRLVEDQQVGLGRQRAGDQRALAHAAGQLMRIGARPRRAARRCRPRRSSSTARASAASRVRPRW